LDTNISSVQAEAWIAKGIAAAEPFLTLAGPAAARRRVVAEAVGEPQKAPFGNFMLTWPEHRTDTEVIRYLPDARFFLQLLRQIYAPALQTRPDLSGLIEDTSRLEVAFTNDVLQVQLQTIANGYSMIRHHALMLFYGTLWLDTAPRAGWFALYRIIAENVVAQSRLPSRETLDAIEANAFSHFVGLAARSINSPDALLADRNSLGAISEYFSWAAVAVAAVERDHRATQPDERAAWHRNHLSDGYGSPEYLMAAMRRLWQPGPSNGNGHH
jgi:hypothetical protein